MRSPRRSPRKSKVNFRSGVFTLSHAKSYLGRLIDKAGKGETVYIVRGELRFLEESLEETDGLDWKTMVRCDRIYLLPKAQFNERKGSVTGERRYLIGRKIVEVFRLPIHRQ